MAATATPKSPRPSEPTPDTLAEVKRRARFVVTGHSGATYELRALTLDDLASEDGIPDDLIRVALLEAHTPGGVSAEIARALHDETEHEDGSSVAAKLSADVLRLRDRIVLRAVVKPELKESDVADLDPFDRHMIAEFAQRQRNVDAAGRQVGADTLDTFRRACRELARAETDEARKAVLLEMAELQ